MTGILHRGGRIVDRRSGFFVALAATLWVADRYFRPALVTHMAATQIVFAEDVLITLFLLPLLPGAVRSVRGLSRRTWLALLVVGIGPQALATALFTWSLTFAFPAHGAPQPDVANEVYLLYLAQPLVAISLARLVLHERRRRTYWPLALLALAGVYLIVFQEDATAPFSSLSHGRVEAALLVLGAVALWGSGTVLGRYALRAVAPIYVATLRFVIALPVLLVLLLVDRGGAAFSGYSVSQLPSLLGIALIPGVLAMLLYYRALRGTPASTATIAELAYPAALFLAFSLPSPVGVGAPLHPVAIAGTACLVVAVTSLTVLRGRAVTLPRGRTAQPAPASS